MSLRLFALLTLLCFCLSGCTNFKPVSPQHINYDIEVGQITFGDKPNKSAYLFKRKIKELFSLQSNPSKKTYYLNASVNKTTTSYGTQQNSTNTRAILKFQCTYELIDKTSNKVIASGSATAADSYEISTSLYSSVVTEEATTDRIALTLANELKNIVDSKLTNYSHQQELP